MYEILKVRNGVNKEKLRVGFINRLFDCLPFLNDDKNPELTKGADLEIWKQLELEYDKICYAYQVLRKPFLKNLYDLYGNKGLENEDLKFLKNEELVKQVLGLSNLNRVSFYEFLVSSPNLKFHKKMNILLPKIINQKISLKQLFYKEIKVENHKIKLEDPNQTVIKHQNFIINLQIEKEELFEKSGLDLIFLKPLKFHELLTQKTLSYKYIDGKSYDLEIPKVYKTEIRLKGKGFCFKEHCGDFVIKFKLIFPKFLGKSTKDKIREFFNQNVYY